MKDFFEYINENKSKNRPVCFLTLNDKLERQKLIQVLTQISDAGFGGVYMHARSGYIGTYLSEEWFESTDIIVDFCEKNGMECWVYDEFGWPSGVAGGATLKEDVDVYQKWLIRNDTPDNPRGKVVGFYDRNDALVAEEAASYSLELVENRSYIDVLSAKVTDCFIANTHEKYRIRYGNRIKGFFTDEPQFGLHNPAWNQEIETYLKARFEDYLKWLPTLFNGDSDKEFRIAYLKKVSDDFCHNYVERIAKWCNKYGYQLTGHFLEEKGLMYQLASCGDMMAMYGKMQCPGMDWLGQEIGDMAAPKQVSSVCQRYGRKRSVSECFALIGYGASFDVMKHIVDWEVAGGISNICNIVSYSTRGRRKRDYPAGITLNQPYYDKLKIYNDYIAGICTITAGLQEQVEVLLIEPLLGCREGFSYGKRGDEATLLNQKYLDAVHMLTRKHILYHIASPAELEGAKRIREGIQIGRCTYRQVISLDEYTDTILKGLDIEPVKNIEEIQRQIQIIGSGEENLYVSLYKYENQYVGFVKNLSDDEISVDITKDGKSYLAVVDLRNMTYEHPPKLQIPSKGCRIVVFDKSSEKPDADSEYKVIPVRNEGFTYENKNKNTLLLDFADYRIIGESGRTSIIKLFEKLIETAYVGKLEMEFTFENRGYRGDDIRLYVENPENFKVLLNGQEISFHENESQRCTLKQGMNTVILSTEYKQDERMRKLLNMEAGEEGDFNMIGGIMELENIYITGDFGVYFEETDIKRRMVECRKPYIGVKTQNGSCWNAVLEGYPFYSGKFLFKKQIYAKKEEKLLDLHIENGAVEIYVDGRHQDTVLWNDGLVVLPDIEPGEHELTIEVSNTLRNVYGPNHNIYDDGIMVGYTTFSSRPGWCDRQDKDMWTDDYRLARFGFCIN